MACIPLSRHKILQFISLYLDGVHCAIICDVSHGLHEQLVLFCFGIELTKRIIQLLEVMLFYIDKCVAK